MSETSKTVLGKEVSSLDVSPQFDAYSGVEIVVDNENSFFAGNRNGRILTIENAWGSQAQANAILADLQAKGFQYQPYTADGAILNPAAEIGDGVTISDTYSGIYTVSKKFGRLMKSDISAPQDEEVDHEFPYEPKQDRVYKRELSEARASISINANSITSEVTARTNADNALGTRITNEANTRQAADTTLNSKIEQTATSIKSTVAASQRQYDTTGKTVNYYGYGAPTIAVSGNNGKYYLNQSNGYYYKCNGSSWVYQSTLPLMTTTLASQISQNSTDITAKVSKTGGSSSSFAWTLTDSSWELKSNNSTVFKVNSSGAEVKGVITATSGAIGGFTIGSSSLYNGMNNINSTDNGVYVGTNGIACGGGKFKVTSGGAVSATNMTLSGTLTVGGVAITAESLRQGAERANAGYGTWNGTTNTVNSNGGYWSSGAGYGYSYNSATQPNTSSYPSQFRAGVLYCGTLSATTGLAVSGSGGATFGAHATFMGGMKYGSTEVSWKSKYVITYIGVSYDNVGVGGLSVVTNVSRSGEYIYYLGN